MARMSAIYMKTKLSDGSRYKASLRDADNRRLSIGETLLRTDYACFWPRSPKGGNPPLEKIKTLVVSGGRRLPIKCASRQCGDPTCGHIQLDFADDYRLEFSRKKRGKPAV